MLDSPARKALVTGLGVTLTAALLARVTPAEYAANVVAALFAGAVYLLVLNKDPATIRAHGLSLGGVFEPQPLSPKHIAREIYTAFGWALCACALTFPAFWIGYRLWFGVHVHFHWGTPAGIADEALGQLLVIALPEEMFYRGYLQSALAQGESRTIQIFGARVGLSLLTASAIFALGHLLSTPHVSRLSVFFPALVFGWMRIRTRGIGSGVFYHAACNLFSTWLAYGYGLRG
ncbi:MAG TPA: MrtC family glutamic-type intramembrane protease [Polyangiaceae bacterium]|jgi:hypothetical protein|nr:MrtC family glutamic-type intramembrane protease [Polyangiaceae bacterium]